MGFPRSGSDLGLSVGLPERRDVKCWHTYAPSPLRLLLTSSLLRGPAFPGSESGERPWDRQVPRAPLPPCGVTAFRGRPLASSPQSVTPPSSLLRAHASIHCPLAAFGFPRASGLCRLLPAPAAQMVLPDIISADLSPRALDPYPGCLQGAFARFFPRSFGLPRLGHRVGASANNPNSYFSWGPFSGLQSFHYVRARKFARLSGSPHPDANASRRWRPRLLRPRPITVGYLPRAVVMLTAHIRAIVGEGTPPLQIGSLVGCSAQCRPCRTFGSSLRAVARNRRRPCCDGSSRWARPSPTPPTWRRTMTPAADLPPVVDVDPIGARTA